jgi:hypothetical protein
LNDDCSSSYRSNAEPSRVSLAAVMMMLMGKMGNLVATK